MNSFNKIVLEQLLTAKRLKLDDIAERTGIPLAELVDEINKKKGPGQGILKKIAQELIVPPFVFYMETSPEISEVPVDFRSASANQKAKSRSTLESLDMAESLQELAVNLGFKDTLPSDISLEELASENFSSDIRKELDISFEDQLNAKSPSAFYWICRSRIEQYSLLVMHETFPSDDGSGFCLADSELRVIVINTFEQNVSRRIFTLFHELGHALSNKTGISDPFKTHNSLEKRCNLFAAQLLMPKEMMLEHFKRLKISANPSRSEIAKLSKKINISQEAIIVRLEQLKLVAAGSHSRWLSAVQEDGNPDWITKGGGSSNIPEERKKLAKFGTTFARIFSESISSGKITPLDLFRHSGLKPKYQKPYFSYASSVEHAIKNATSVEYVDVDE